MSPFVASASFKLSSLNPSHEAHSTVINVGCNAVSGHMSCFSAQISGEIKSQLVRHVHSSVPSTPYWPVQMNELRVRVALDLILQFDEHRGQHH